MISADVKAKELSFMESWWRERTLAAGGSPSAWGALRGVLVYEDKLTREWAVETWDRVGVVAGGGNLETSSWQVGQLSQPQTLSEAVQKSAVADVVLVALRAAEQLPIPFYVWVDAWLPRRVAGQGALVGLILSPSELAGASRQVEDYLRAVAGRARMEFTARQRQLDLELDAAYGEDLARRATLVTPLLGQILDQRPSPYQHWGINE